MNSVHKDILIKKYEDFVIEEYSERKKLLRFEVLNILADIENLDSNDLHIWGLIYYHTDEDREYHLGLALEKFLESYEMDSQNFMACLYIAHCFHDLGNLQNALKYYNLVNKEELREFQLWRYVKLIEQIGFCNYKLGNKDLGRVQFLEVLNWYRKLPSEDRIDPTELMQCLPKTDEIVIELIKLET